MDRRRRLGFKNKSQSAGQVSKFSYEAQALKNDHTHFVSGFNSSAIGDSREHLWCY
jgi:hypothetical protein